jgi:endonuclease/exonuclease/phosphatase family metal-dependent hydrolase
MAKRTKLSFASFNLYNLNQPGLPIYRDRDGWSAEQHALKINWTAAQLNRLKADVWGFQELWHQQSLQDCFNSAGLTDDYHLLTPPDHHGGHIVCGAAVRKKLLIGEPEWIVKFPDEFILQSGGDDPQTSDLRVAIDRFSRPVLHFTIRPRKNGKTISVYVVHFKSKGPTDVYREKWYRDNNEYYAKHRSAIGSAISTIRRTAEATALRMMLTQTMKNNGNPVVVLGDCNDSTHSNTLNILTDQPNYLLSGYSKGGSDTALYTAETLQEYRSLRDVYYTHIYKNLHESLDQILLSQEFYDNSRNRLWAFKGLEVVNDHLNHDDHKKTGSTDHGIVKASFEYRPA